MNKKILFPITAIFIFLSNGCATFYANRYPGFNYSTTDSTNIPIYQNFPPSSYEIIGEVGGDGAPLSSWKGMGKKLREYAAQIGGDAIVIQKADTPYVGTYTTPGHSTTTYSGHSSGSISAYNYGGYTSGNIYGSSYGQAHTTYHPGTNTPMYGKSVRAFIIKFKTNSNITHKKSIGNKFSTDMIDDNFKVNYWGGKSLGKIERDMTQSKVYKSWGTPDRIVKSSKNTIMWQYSGYSRVVFCKREQISE